MLHLQIYSYERQRTLEMVYLCALAVVGDVVACRGAGIESTDIKRIARKKSLSGLFCAFASTFTQGVNRLEFVTDSEGGVGRRVHFTCTLSPLCDDWKKISRLPSTAVGRNAYRSLMSLHSRQEFVSGWQVRRYPTCISITLDLGKSPSLKSATEVAGHLAATLVGFTRVHEFVGFVDDRVVLAAEDILGGQPYESQRMDTHFDRPHSVTFGVAATMLKYARAMEKAAPSLGVSYTKAGPAGVVEFQRWPSTEVPRTKWHTLEM